AAARPPAARPGGDGPAANPTARPPRSGAAARSAPHPPGERPSARSTCGAPPDQPAQVALATGTLVLARQGLKGVARERLQASPDGGQLSRCDTCQQLPSA